MDENTKNNLIREILTREWDPIGIKDVPGAPKDEYDAYIDVIRGFLSKPDPSTDEIVDRLLDIERRDMMLDISATSRERCEQVADSLIKAWARLGSMGKR